MKIHPLKYLTFSRQSLAALTLAGLMSMILSPSVQAAQLRIGAATVDITPSEPAALDGQRNVRISKKPETPITATALALESRDGDKSLDQAIMVSCDLVAIRPGLLQMVREKVKPRLKDFDLNKLFLNATHTHTAPVTIGGRYSLPESGVVKPEAYVEFLTDRLAEVIAASWQKRAIGKAGWGQGQAVIAHNRRAVYADGTAVMYGATGTDNFRGIEGYEDHDLDVLFLWNKDDQLIATAVNVPCPAQEVEGRSAINADFWHPVRETLRSRYGQDLHVLAWTGAAGDQSPRPIYRKAADERMRKLRGQTRLEELARRIVNGWEDAYEGARKDIRSDLVMRHRAQVIEIPYRKVTEAEVTLARNECTKFEKIPAQRWNFLWNQSVVARYDTQQASGVGTFEMELHVLRLGDVAIATNEFELFTDFGIQMKARSPAVQTFLIQLTGSAGYLPSERAVRGGGYSAVIQSSRVGPDGGQELVERTVAAMKELWAAP